MENRDYLELTFRSIQCFSDDGKLGAQEFESLIAIDAALATKIEELNTLI